MLSLFELQMVLLGLLFLIALAQAPQDLASRLPWKQPKVDDDDDDRQEKGDDV